MAKATVTVLRVDTLHKLALQTSAFLEYAMKYSLSTATLHGLKRGQILRKGVVIAATRRKGPEGQSSAQYQIIGCK